MPNCTGHQRCVVIKPCQIKIIASNQLVTLVGVGTVVFILGKYDHSDFLTWNLSEHIPVRVETGDYIWTADMMTIGDEFIIPLIDPDKEKEVERIKELDLV